MKVLLILFGIFLALPMTFRATRDLLGPWVADAAGDPTGAGFLFHALVLAVLVIGTSKTISMFKGENNRAERGARGKYTMDDFTSGRPCAASPGSEYTGVVQSDLTTCSPSPA